MNRQEVRLMPKGNKKVSQKKCVKEHAVIHVCKSTGCKSLKSSELIENLKKEAERRGCDYVVKSTGCFGMCEAGPIVLVDPEEIFYTYVKPEDARSIVMSLGSGRTVRRLLFTTDDGKKALHMNDLEFYRHQDKYLMRRKGKIDPESLEDFEAHGGFKGLRKALSSGPAKVIEEVSESGLRGRGGAGFPTGKKWSFIAKNSSPRKYLVANADEGDPGSFMDRVLLEGDPFAMIEGMIIAAFAIGATDGIIYVRAEYPDAIAILEKCLQSCREKGYLGKSICGKKGFDFDIRISKGSGAFVCGEETSLMNSVEGGRGTPRLKPPFPAERGIHGYPTNINNVKTYAYVSHILRDGPKDFKSRGTEQSPGTAVLCLTGKVRTTGVVEVPMGTPLRTLVTGIGGGVKDGKGIKAVMTGGPSGGVIPEHMLDLGVDYESLASVGSIMGSGGVLVFDEDDSMPAIAKFFIGFTKSESCGKCVPCREGTSRLYEILERLESGDGSEDDLELLERLCHYIKDNSACGLGQTAPNPVLSTLKFFRSEYDALVHGDDVRDEKKDAGDTGDSNTDTDSGKKFSITGACTGCGKCAEVCPQHCISGEKGNRHKIDQSGCISCGSCEEVCPVGAVISR